MSCTSRQPSTVSRQPSAFSNAEANDRTNDRPFWLELRHDLGRPSLESALTEIGKLARLRELELLTNLFAGLSPKVLIGYRQRAVAEELYELRRHPDNIRYTLVAAYCYLCRQEITDNLVELPIDIVHAIGARGEKKVTQQFIADFHKVEGKNALFGQLAGALVTHPDGVIKEVAFPVVSEETLPAL